MCILPQSLEEDISEKDATMWRKPHWHSASLNLDVCVNGI
jgi:hypothetical protein